jgi:hypothetical protein
MHALLLIIILLWHFSPFSGHTLPVAGGLRQFSFYEVKDVSPMPNPQSGGLWSLSLCLASWSKPV